MLGPLATNRAKLIMGMLVKEVTPFQDGACWKVVGSNPGAGKGFLSVKLYLCTWKEIHTLFKCGL